MEIKSHTLKIKLEIWGFLYCLTWEKQLFFKAPSVIKTFFLFN